MRTGPPGRVIPPTPDEAESPVSDTGTIVDEPLRTGRKGPLPPDLEVEGNSEEGPEGGADRSCSTLGRDGPMVDEEDVDSTRG